MVKTALDVLQERGMLASRLRAATSPEAVATLRAQVRLEEEKKAVAHQETKTAMAAACAKEDARLKVRLYPCISLSQLCLFVHLLICYLNC